MRPVSRGLDKLDLEPTEGVGLVLQTVEDVGVADERIRTATRWIMEGEWGSLRDKERAAQRVLGEKS